MIEQIVESSFIEKISWHEADVNIAQPAQIWVHFKNGWIKYFNSSREIFDNFCKAESAGKFYHQHLLGKSKQIPWQVQNARNIAQAEIIDNQKS